MRRISTFLRRFGDDRRGVAAPITALGLTVVLGFVGLGVDIGHGYLQRRTAQHAADSAAFSGAAALMQGAADPAAEARAVAARYGFDPAKVTVNLPPQTGPNTGSAGAVEVLVERPGRRFFSALLGVGASTIRARAVGLTGEPGDGCVVALNASASASAYETGSADVKLTGCSLYANSTSPSALMLKGGAKLDAKSVELVGGYDQVGNTSITTAEGIHTKQAPVRDPYDELDVPPYTPGCGVTGVLSGGYGPKPDGTPLVLCDPKITNAAVTLAPGVYIVRGGLALTGGSLSGSGVTLVLTEGAAGYGEVEIRGNAQVDLAAPTTGEFAGVAIYQDRKAPAGGENVINGGADFKIEGALYFPSQKLKFLGNATGASTCLQIVASEVEFFGNARLGLDCSGKGVRAAGARRTTLVE
jgi:Tfp pilus assembly protein PilX